MDFSGKAGKIEDIFDLLHFLETHSSEGVFFLERLPHREEWVRLYLKKGRISRLEHNIPLLKDLSALAERDLGLLGEVLKSFMHYVSLFWSEFFFRFDPKELKEEDTNGVMVSHVLLDFSAEKDEVFPLLKRLLARPIGLKVKGRLGEGKFSSLEVWLYGEAVRGRSLKEIVFGNVPLKALLGAITKLVKTGMLEPYFAEEEKEKPEKAEASKEEREEYVSRDTIESFKNFLGHMIGPVADLIVEEALEEIGASEKGLPVDRRGDFLQRIIDKIPEGCFYEGEACDQVLTDKFEEVLSSEVKKK